MGNLVEQLWNFVWPAAVAIVHPSLLPVAVVGFFTKVLKILTFPWIFKEGCDCLTDTFHYTQLAIFVGGPLVGKLMDCFPRVPAYHSLNVIQVFRCSCYLCYALDLLLWLVITMSQGNFPLNFMVPCFKTFCQWSYYVRQLLSCYQLVWSYMH